MDKDYNVLDTIRKIKTNRTTTSKMARRRAQGNRAKLVEHGGARFHKRYGSAHCIRCDSDKEIEIEIEYDENFRY